MLDVPSLIKNLAEPYLPYCFKLPTDNRYTMEMADDHIKFIRVGELQITAQKYIFTAGKGNINLTKDLPTKPTAQLRPLQMVLVKDKNLLPLYGHCIGLGSTPRLTITTHVASDQMPVWYLGGKLAEDGVQKTASQQIEYTKQELVALFPRLDLSAAQYATLAIDRAEAKQDNGLKPDSVTIFNTHNYITAWPTKLALAPILAQEIITQIKAANIKPQQPSLEKINLVQPGFAEPIWEQVL
mgnify:FL=1